MRADELAVLKQLAGPVRTDQRPEEALKALRPRWTPRPWPATPLTPDEVKAAGGGRQVDGGAGAPCMANWTASARR
jgi:hypothetical protein